MRHKVLDSILHSQWHALLMVGVFSIFFNLLMLTAPLFMLAVFANVMTSKNLDTLLLLSLAAGVALLFQALVDYVRTRLLVRVGIAIDLALAPRVIEAMIMKAGQDSANDRRALGDAAEIRKFVTDIGVMSLIDLPFVPLYLLLIWWMHPLLGAVGVAAAIGLLILAIVNDLLTREPGEIAHLANRRRGALTDECLGNADVVRSMGMLESVIERCRTATLESLHALQRGADRAAISRSLVRTTRVGIQVAVYGVGAWLFLNDQLMVGAIVAAAVLLARALAPLEYSVFAWRSALGLRQANRRLGALLGARSPAGRAERSEEDSAHALLELRRAVVVAPETNRVLLNNISFALSPRELLGVVGPVGAGKSTLGRLMAGLIVPRTGSVLLKGRRFDAVTSAVEGASIGYCPQEPQLFSGTIADNIARFNESGTMDDVVRAARLVGLHERIEALPDAYATVLATGGHPLSSGMRQQVALARAFFGDPDLIVLDEPAAWVDQLAQSALLQAIDSARSRGAGIALITHQPALLRAADRIAVIRGGVIEMLGPRGQVLQRIGMRARAPSGDEATGEGVPPRARSSSDGPNANVVAGSFALAAPLSGKEKME